MVVMLSILNICRSPEYVPEWATHPICYSREAKCQDPKCKILGISESCTQSVYMHAAYKSLYQLFIGNTIISGKKTKNIFYIVIALLGDIIHSLKAAVTPEEVSNPSPYPHYPPSLACVQYPTLLLNLILNFPWSTKKLGQKNRD